MKGPVVVQLSILFCITMCGGEDSWKGAVPDGFLLGLKVVQIDQPHMNYYYNHASLFKIEFDGNVTQLWNYSYQPSDVLFSDNLFAVDSKNGLVYLGTVDRFLAIDLMSGKTKINIPLKAPNLQYFWNYDYFAEDDAIYGVCTGNDQWNWCRIKQNGTNSAHVDFLYHLYYTEEFGPIEDIYYLDKEDQTIWYYPGVNTGEFAVAINYTTGKNVFTSTQDQDEDLCIVHDYEMNRVFTYIWNSSSLTSVGLGELFQKPKPRKVLIKLPTTLRSLRPTNFGTCAYDQGTHTMIALLSNQTIYFYHAMPTDLLLLDTVHLTYKLIPLPIFQEKWDSSEPVTAVKFISHNRKN